MSKLVQESALAPYGEPTAGVEIERHKVEISRVQEVFQAQLYKSQTADAIHALGLDQIFPEEARETSHLCLVKKNDIPFMTVIFDDNSAMDQLEFISTPYQNPHHSLGGVKTISDFCTDKNMKDIGIVTSTFPAAVKSIGSSRAGAISFKSEEFTFEFPGYAVAIFTDESTRFTESDSQAVHLTHSLPVSSNAEYLKDLKNFLVLQRQVQVVKFKKEKVELTPRFQEIEQSYPDSLLDQTFLPRRQHAGWNTGLRNNNHPIFKMPRDHFYSEELERNSYVQSAIDGEVLHPVLNLVEDTIPQISLYEDLLGKIKDQIHILSKEKKALTSDQALRGPIMQLLVQEPTPLDKANQAYTKLQKTILGLKQQVCIASRDVLDMETQYDEIKRDFELNGKKYKDISIFDSVDEKFQLVPLCEHRMGTAPVQNTVEKIIKRLDQKNGLQEDITLDCQTLRDSFKPLEQTILTLQEQQALLAKQQTLLMQQQFGTAVTHKPGSSAEMPPPSVAQAQTREQMMRSLSEYRPKKFAFERSRSQTAISREFRRSVSVPSASTSSSDLAEQAQIIGAKLREKQSSTNSKRRKQNVSLAKPDNPLERS